jgi:DNA invertase Pin-like site-specific DNA recombinase
METQFEKMFSVKEVAAVLSCSRDTISRGIKNGLIRASELPSSSTKRSRNYRCWRVPEFEVRRLAGTKPYRN